MEGGSQAQHEGMHVKVALAWPGQRPALEGARLLTPWAQTAGLQPASPCGPKPPAL